MLCINGKVDCFLVKQSHKPDEEKLGCVANEKNEELDYVEAENKKEDGTEGNSRQNGRWSE